MVKASVFGTEDLRVRISSRSVISFFDDSFLYSIFVFSWLSFFLLWIINSWGAMFYSPLNRTNPGRSFTIVGSRSFTGNNGKAAKRYSLLLDCSKSLCVVDGEFLYLGRDLQLEEIHFLIHFLA